MLDIAETAGSIITLHDFLRGEDLVQAALNLGGLSVFPLGNLLNISDFGVYAYLCNNE